MSNRPGITVDDACQVGEILHTARTRLDLRVADVAQYAGISVTRLHQLEKGTVSRGGVMEATKAPREVLGKLADLLRLDFDKRTRLFELSDYEPDVEPASAGATAAEEHALALSIKKLAPERRAKVEAMIELWSREL
ncbi:helix-turn-helix domain-containing protein [Nocardia sp. NBC_01503]|uniref:helix-turn-helix domain-containing protein n=1 Tax=Nocardia sp. NBC_01503 TaxID=2975997 RepID=UPI002E7AF8B0|nr:helix-turn-helix transcriptional regulator [Nocardia sp. NBC_01503]WTL35699.1 helix-turn-helix domain-containing protein [Nocardia sp. NBC_01503]